MRTLITIALTMLLSVATVEAQRLRLGETMPDLSIHLDNNTSIDDIATDYVMLVFLLPSSETSDGIVRKVTSGTASYCEQITTIYVAYGEYKLSWHDTITAQNTFIAHDHRNRTLREFSINYLPFGVIYDTKRKRTQWFGSMHTFTTETIELIINR